MSVIQGPLHVDPSKPLWRYISLSTLFHYLDEKMFLPSIKKLVEGDPTEGLRICRDHDCEVKAFTDEEVENLSQWVHEKRLSEGLKETSLWNVWWEYFLAVSEARCAWCWFASENESATMWRLYGKEEVAIRSSLARLDPVLSRSGREWLVSRINYLDRQRQLDAGDNATPDEKEKWLTEMRPWIRQPFLAKRTEYRDEHEVRFVTINPGRGDGCSFSLPRPEDWIEEIVFSGRIPESEVASLKALIGKLSPGLACRTRKSQLWERDPSLERNDFFALAQSAGLKNRAEEAAKWPKLLRSL